MTVQQHNVLSSRTAAETRIRRRAGQPSARPLLFSMALCLAALLGFAGPAAAPGGPGEAVMAIFPPTASAADVMVSLHEADGEFVSLGRFDNIAISRAAEPGYSDRLYEAGALLVIDPAVAQRLGL